MSNATRARLGGIAVFVRHGTDHMQTVGRAGMSALDRRIAAEAGIPDGLDEAEYAARLKAARSAYYLRLAERRWASKGGR